MQLLNQIDVIDRMDKLKKHIYDESNGLHYTLEGDYYIPDLKLPEGNRPIGRFGRLHRDYLKQEHPVQYSYLILAGELCILSNRKPC